MLWTSRFLPFWRILNLVFFFVMDEATKKEEKQKKWITLKVAFDLFYYIDHFDSFRCRFIDAFNLIAQGMCVYALSSIFSVPPHYTELIVPLIWIEAEFFDAFARFRTFPSSQQIMSFQFVVFFSSRQLVQDSLKCKYIWYQFRFTATILLTL